MPLAAAGEPEVAERLLVDREHHCRCAHLRRHVGDGRAVGQAEVAKPRAEHLDELADHADLAQQLGNGEHQIRGGHAARRLVHQSKPDDLRHQKVDRLAEQHRLGLDAADSPAQHPQGIDHRRVRVGADERVRKSDGHFPDAAHRHDRGQVLQVDLVHDTGAWWYDPEVPKRLLGPAEQGVPLTVALVLALHVAPEGDVRTEDIDLNGVVDNQVGRHQRVDLRRIAAEPGHRRAHGG